MLVVVYFMERRTILHLLVIIYFNLLFLVDCSYESDRKCLKS